MALKEAVSEADLLRLMSEIVSLREQVAQAELRAPLLETGRVKACGHSVTKRRNQRRQ